MMIIETCPECGHDLKNLALLTNPPISRRECWNCGWNWTGERKQEETVRVPFGSNVLIANETLFVFDNHKNEMTIRNV